MKKIEQHKYVASAASLRTLNLLRKHPGISATAFAGLRWPHLRPGGGKMKPALLAAQHLRLLKNKGLVRIRYSGNPFKERTKCIYYCSDHGFEVCEYYRILNKYHASQNQN